MWDSVYRHFMKPGRVALRIYPGLRRDLKTAGINIYYEVYAAFVILGTLIATIVTAFLVALLILLFNSMILIPFVSMIPFAVFAILLFLPKMKASLHTGKLEKEFPYVVAYMNTIAAGGMSPFIGFERISKSYKVFPQSALLAKEFQLLIRGVGKDPLSAFRELSERTESREVRDTLMGFVVTVVSGGDILSYLEKKTRTFFSNVLIAVKVSAERIAVLLESYLSAVLLPLIGFSVMYFVAVAYAGILPFGVSPEMFFLILYVVLPMISGITIYLMDLLQVEYPTRDYRPYLFFFTTTLPIAIVLLVLTTILSPLREVLLVVARLVNAPRYVEDSVLLSMILIVASIPSVIYIEIISKEYKILEGLTLFMRDLLEMRKTGLTPEKCIVELSKRDYGIFTKYLRTISMELTIGLPLSKIFEKLEKKIYVWFAKVLLFVLVDSTEVSGGTLETIENLAWLSENIELVEKEKRSTMRTLFVVPYIGSIISVLSIILLVAFMGSLPGVIGAGYQSAASSVLVAIVLNSYIMGLIAGKASGGAIFYGFKHSLILTTITLLMILFSGAVVSPIVFTAS